MLIALGAIFLYVMFRFEWKFSAGAVAALFHDVLITLGVFSALGLDFDLTVLAAVLAVIGYSSTTPSWCSTGSARTSAGCGAAPPNRSSTAR